MVAVSFFAVVVSFFALIVAVSFFAVAVSFFALIIAVSFFAVVVCFFALIVTVSFFAVAVSCFALIIAVSFFAAAVSCLALIVLGSLQVLVAEPVHRCRDVGLWREIIFDFDLSRFNTTGFVRSYSPYRPRGVSIFPDRRRSMHTKERNKQDRNQGSQRMTQKIGKPENALTVPKETNRLCPSSQSSCRS